MHGLKHKANYIKGRCRLCQYKELCTGSMRVRGYRTYNDLWAPDPQCYLTDEEIGLDQYKLMMLREKSEEFPIPEELLGK